MYLLVEFEEIRALHVASCYGIVITEISAMEDEHATVHTAAILPG